MHGGSTVLEHKMSLSFLQHQQHRE
uniref:Uncharacterized protein n=1 Tax=Anguilla anguilla TaxID=7936 RepID=A0A0E9Q610_ANGAN